jgi:hypothetical protein
MTTTFSASVRLRPTRIGFLVRGGDIASLREVMQIGTCLWGGLFNPIIPVCENVPDCWSEAPFPTLTGAELAHGYIRFFEPDVFVEAEPGLGDQIGLSAGSLDLGEPRLLPASAFSNGGTDERFGGYGLTVASIYRKLYERDFRFITRDGDRVATVDNAGPDGAFIDATFGGFPTGGWLQPLCDHYGKTFSPLAISADAAGFETIIRKRLRFPLSITREGLTQDYNSAGRDNPTIFVVDPDSPYDLVDLWNLRLFHSDVLPISARWFADNRDLVSEFIAYNYRPLPGNPNGVMIMPTLQFGRSIGKERAQQLVSAARLTLPTDCRWAFKFWYDAIWRNSSDEFVFRPQPVLVSATEVDNEVTLSGDRDASIRLPDLAPDFASEYGHNAARWVNVVRFSRYSDTDRTALVLPPDYDVGTDFRLRLGDPAFIAREGFILPQRHKRSVNFLQLPDGTTAVTAWLRARGITATISDAGRVAEQVLRALGGTRRATLLADQETLQLLDRMAKSVRRHSDGTIEEFEDRAAPVGQWKAIVSRRLSNSFYRWISLDAFIKANVFRLGLSLTCPHCLKRNWTGIGSLQETITCARCLNQFEFPQGTLEFERTPWQYRVVGPFSVPDFAGGAYATVLALRTLATMLSVSDVELTYTTGLDLVGDTLPKMEVDFAGWYRRRQLLRRQDVPDLFFGEAKSFGTECFKSTDIDRMERIIEKFPDAFIIFAMLKNELSEDEKSRIGQLALRLRQRPNGRSAQSKIIVLTGIELFADWRIGHAWEKIGGRHSVFSKSLHVQLDYLQTLADVTQQLYLDLPDPWAHLRQMPKQGGATNDAEVPSNSESVQTNDDGRISD